MISERTEDPMTLVTKDCEPGAEVEEPTFGLRLSGNRDSAGTEPFRSLN